MTTLQAVEAGDLFEAVQRTRYGVNGSPKSFLPASWNARLRRFMVDTLSSSRQQRTVPTSM